MANITARVMGRNRKRPMPGMRASGDSTRKVHSVDTSSGMATSLAPFRAASRGVAPMRQMAVRVLQADDGAVDHRPDGQRQPGQGHDVDRLPGVDQADDAHQHRQRQGQNGDDRHAPLPEEQQNHQRTQHGPDGPFLHQGGDRGPDVHRLVHDHLEIDVRMADPCSPCRGAILEHRSTTDSVLAPSCR